MVKVIGWALIVAGVGLVLLVLYVAEKKNRSYDELSPAFFLATMVIAGGIFVVHYG